MAEPESGMFAGKHVSAWLHLGGGWSTGNEDWSIALYVLDSEDEEIYEPNYNVDYIGDSAIDAALYAEQAIFGEIDTKWVDRTSRGPST